MSIIVKQMLSKGTTYTVELLCAYSDWWRYNIYMIAVGFDRDGNRVSYNNFTDRVCDLGYGGTSCSAPADYDPRREMKMVTDPCDYIDIYLYAVTNTFPQSVEIKDSPPFTVTMKSTVSGTHVDEKEFEVNQWGGLTVVAYRVDAGQ